MCAWFAAFFEKAFVSRVMRRSQRGRLRRFPVIVAVCHRSAQDASGRNFKLYQYWPLPSLDEVPVPDVLDELPYLQERRQ